MVGCARTASRTRGYGNWPRIAICMAAIHFTRVGADHRKAQDAIVVGTDDGFHEAMFFAARLGAQHGACRHSDYAHGESVDVEQSRACLGAFALQ